MNNEGILITCGEGGVWEIKKEPYATIEVATEEDYMRLEHALELLRAEENGLIEYKKDSKE